MKKGGSEAAGSLVQSQGVSAGSLSRQSASSSPYESLVQSPEKSVPLTPCVGAGGISASGVAAAKAARPASKAAGKPPAVRVRLELRRRPSRSRPCTRSRAAPGKAACVSVQNAALAPASRDWLCADSRDLRERGLMLLLGGAPPRLPRGATATSHAPDATLSSSAASAASGARSLSAASMAGCSGLPAPAAATWVRRSLCAGTPSASSALARAARSATCLAAGA